MSDSELSDAPLQARPDHATIESTLRQIVRNALKNDEEITVRIARARAEDQLQLEADFFKNNDWKERSRDIINAAVEEPDSPVKERKKPAAKAGRKRKSEEPAQRPKKRSRKSPVVESELEEDDEEVEEKPKARSRNQSKPKVKAATPVIDSEEEDQETQNPESHSTKASSPISDDNGENEAAAPANHDTNEPEIPTSQTLAEEPAQPADEDNDSDSDLSSLIDDPPPKKKRNSSAGRAKKATAAATGRTTKKPSTNAKEPPSSEEEEIKRLQSYLLKCGIRKFWNRELAPFDTPRAKISHLKAMLSDAGMTGRFSAEKAKAIKEARELEAELEAARSFEEQFGTGGRGRRGGLKKRGSMKEESAGEEDGDDGDEEEQGEGNKRPGGRLLPKGLVDFGDSGDDESD